MNQAERIARQALVAREIASIEVAHLLHRRRPTTVADQSAYVRAVDAATRAVAFSRAQDGIVTTVPGALDALNRVAERIPEAASESIAAVLSRIPTTGSANATGDSAAVAALVASAMPAPSTRSGSMPFQPGDALIDSAASRSGR